MKILRYMLLTVLLIGLGTASAAQYYTVVNVDASDTLNVRTGVEYGDSLKDTEVVGALPANASGVEATGITVEFQGRLWRQIRYKGNPGWVADRFLKSEGLPQDPGNVQCGGTEPFWDLSVNGMNAVYSTPGGDRAMSIKSVRRGANRRNVWAIAMAGENNAAITGLLVLTDQFSDGMSDFNYALEFYLIGFETDAGPIQGCCTFS